jgi:acyl carrier protein
MIGAPFAGMRLRLYDARQQWVPAGVPGELYIGGASVSRGYLDRPELTAEKYVQVDGERWYRTGDLVRVLNDGNIEFLGRGDNQVKIRGYRIELGEIEAVLGGQPGVAEAVVLAREDTPGDKRLVAYVVPAADQRLSAPALRDTLRQRLPDYMVPGAVVLLAALPLTAQGKVDRIALPAPGRADLADASSFGAPGTPIEEEIAAIWAEVLKLERVGVHDNFFALGGHSLLATQVVSRLRSAFGIDLPLRTLFEAPTVAELALAVLQQHAEEADPALLEQLLAELESLGDDAGPGVQADG